MEYGLQVSISYEKFRTFILKFVGIFFFWDFIMFNYGKGNRQAVEETRKRGWTKER